jgi:hypothetical protein
MRSPSDEEWDNITHLERGPQGSGGLAKGQGLVHRVEATPVAEARPEAGVNASGCTCLPGIRLKGVFRSRLGRFQLNCEVPEAWSRTGENPTYGILGGAAGNVAHGETRNPPRNRKGGTGHSSPTGARASALPDRGPEAAVRLL